MTIYKYSKRKKLTWALEPKYKYWDILLLLVCYFLRNAVKDMDKGDAYVLLAEM